MTVSRKQLIANRKNAQKSTGPRTLEGKKRSRLNALKHGLYARDIIVDTPIYREDPEEYDHLLRTVSDELRPTSVLQAYLVRKIANCLWRSRRAHLAETARFFRTIDEIDSDQYHRSQSMEPQDFDDLDADEIRALIDEIGSRMTRYSEFSRNISRYEANLDRQMNAALRLLRTIQKNAANRPRRRQKKR